MNVYERIKIISDNKNLTISAIENECNISNGSISKWKNQMPKADNLYSVAKFLDTSVEYLLTGTELIHKNITKDVSNSAFLNGINQGTVYLNNDFEKKISDEELELLRIYKTLDVRNRIKLLDTAFALEEEKGETH